MILELVLDRPHKRIGAFFDRTNLEIELLDSSDENWRWSSPLDRRPDALLDVLGSASQLLTLHKFSPTEFSGMLIPLHVPDPPNIRFETVDCMWNSEPEGTIQWRLFSDTPDLEVLGIQTQARPYLKGGWVLEAAEERNLPKSLQKAINVGSEWILTGDTKTTLDGWCASPAASSLNAVQFFWQRTNT